MMMYDNISDIGLMVGPIEYFSKYTSCRCAGIITDKQFVFYVQSRDENANHDDILKSLFKIMYPNELINDNYMPKTDITIIGQGRFLTIDVPLGHLITFKQYVALNNLLNELSSVGKNNIQIALLNNVSNKYVRTTNIEEIKKEIDNMYYNQEDFVSVNNEHLEKIIGTPIENLKEYNEYQSNSSLKLH